MLSIIVATSPRRQADLACCLQGLAQQTYQDFEVIVSDDGSEGMQPVLESFKGSFPKLEYLWRPNYRSSSRTRNRGSSAARGEALIFVDTDVVLNPYAVEAYAQALKEFPSTTIWGYIGCCSDVTAPSLWCADRQVNWLDERFFPVSESRFWQHPVLEIAPHELARGHHFAMTRQVFETLGPLDESFIDWGEEAVEYALRGMVRGCPMLLLGDAWGEHLVHTYHEDFHLDAPGKLASKRLRIRQLEAELTGRVPPAQALFGNQLSVLYTQIQQHYLPHRPDALERAIASAA